MGGTRGRKITKQDKLCAIKLIEEAQTLGARKTKACEALGLNIRTLQRWERDKGLPVFRLGRRVYSHPQRILDWLFSFQERGAFYGTDYQARRYYKEELKIHRAMESEEEVAGAVPVASE